MIIKLVTFRFVLFILRRVFPARTESTGLTPKSFPMVRMVGLGLQGSCPEWNCRMIYKIIIDSYVRIIFIHHSMINTCRIYFRFWKNLGDFPESPNVTAESGVLGKYGISTKRPPHVDKRPQSVAR